MDIDLARKAVSAAMCGNWKEAVSLNREAVKENPCDVDALNRLAKAYLECGNIIKAKATSKKVLKLDPINSIAAKSLDKWGSLSGKPAHGNGHTSYEVFLEEPGKTKLAALLHPGSPCVLAALDAGDEVKVSPHAHRVNIVSRDDEYIGRLSDDLAARLRHFLSVGYKYRVHIKSVDKGSASVFIRETDRSEKFKDCPSFPAEKQEGEEELLPQI